MDTLKAVVGVGRDRDGVAIDGPARPAPYRYHDFCTDVWKTGNLYSHFGVQNGGTVAVVPRGQLGADVDTGGDPTRVAPTDLPTNDSPDGSPTNDASRPPTAIPLLGILGGAVVGSRVRVATANPVEAGVVLAHVDDLADVEIEGQSTVLAYGGDSDRADVERFESGLWSENPVEPPEPVAPEDGFLVNDGDDLTHGELVLAAGAVADEYGLDESATVILAAPLGAVGAVVAGLVMPLLVGATIHLAADRHAADSTHDFLVADEDATTTSAKLISTARAEHFLDDARVDDQ